MRKNFLLNTNTNIAEKLKQFATEISAEKYTRVTFFDTFDFRLFNVGKTAEYKNTTFRIKDLQKDKIDFKAKIEQKNKYFSDDFDDKKITNILSNRALVPFSTNEIIETLYKVDFDGKNVTIKRQQVFNKSKTQKFLDFLQVEVKTKNQQIITDFVQNIFGDAVFPAVSLVEELIKLIDIQTIKYAKLHSFNFSATDDFYFVSNQILRQLTDIVVLNLSGLRQDVDIECLHDFRVAMRKIRVFLDEFADILPDEAQYFKQNFKSIQQKTNILRDLDVFLSQKKFFEKFFSRKEVVDLQIFFDFVREKRNDELKSVKAYFHAPNFSILIKKWLKFLDNLQNQKSDKKIYDVCRPVILQSGIRLIEQSEKILNNTQLKKIHKIRIYAKKFRYNLEFFNSFFSGDEQIKTTLNEVKSFQTYLGQLTDYQQIKLFIEDKNAFFIPKKLLHFDED